MTPAGLRQMDRQDDFDDAEDRGSTTRASPTYLRSAPCSPPSMTLRAGSAGGLWPSLTAAPRGAGGIQVGTKKRPDVELRN
jgi:hypothetical protein